MYLSQVVPAPPGWTLYGNPVPGDEIFYLNSDGSVQVFPHPEHGWEIQVHGSQFTIRVDSPASAFRLIR